MGGFPDLHNHLFGMRVLLFLFCCVLLASCGRREPVFVHESDGLEEHSGDLIVFLAKATAQRGNSPGDTNALPRLQTVWWARNRTDELLTNVQVLQVITGSTNFHVLRAALSQRFGAATLPLKTEASGGQTMAWELPQHGMGVFLSEEGKSCLVEVTTRRHKE